MTSNAPVEYPQHMQEFVTAYTAESYEPITACCHCGKDQHDNPFILEEMPMDEFEKAMADIKQG